MATLSDRLSTTQQKYLDTHYPDQPIETVAAKKLLKRVCDSDAQSFSKMVHNAWHQYEGTLEDLPENEEKVFRIFLTIISLQRGWINYSLTAPFLSTPECNSIPTVEGKIQHLVSRADAECKTCVYVRAQIQQLAETLIRQ